MLRAHKHYHRSSIASGPNLPNDEGSDLIGRRRTANNIQVRGVRSRRVVPVRILVPLGCAAVAACSLRDIPRAAADDSNATPPPATQMCANGSWIPFNEFCPVPQPPPDMPPPTKLCIDGTGIPMTDICPPQPNPGVETVAPGPHAVHQPAFEAPAFGR